MVEKMLPELRKGGEDKAASEALRYKRELRYGSAPFSFLQILKALSIESGGGTEAGQGANENGRVPANSAALALCVHHFHITLTVQRSLQRAHQLGEIVAGVIDLFERNAHTPDVNI